MSVKKFTIQHGKTWKRPDEAYFDSQDQAKGINPDEIEWNGKYKRIRELRDLAIFGMALYDLYNTPFFVQMNEIDDSPDAFVMRQSPSKELASEQRYAETDVKQQTGRRDRLLAERDNVMQTFYDKVIQGSLLKSEQKRIAKEIEQAEAVINEAEERLAIINARRERALELARGLDIGKAYVKANEDIKRHFCLALFSKIEIDDNPVYHSDVFRAPRDHHVRVTKVHWHDPINIRHITEAILALSLERGKKAKKPRKIR